ncbi:MAG TPA: DNA gyrase subunit A [Bacillota bacterium]|nr:DNA gyrase subunit A [Bacillota bacterium]
MDNEYKAHESQEILEIGLEKEVKTAYINYAMSVIIGRALPDVRDGLKPVHRRILYAMYKDQLTYDKPFRKSATTVGNVLGHYHPHGDQAVYDSMVRLAQPFSLRYPLVEGHGNFGNIDGDSAAAYRYTEARMAKIANLMLQDIDKNVVDFSPNFDNKLQEPDYLPARFPNLLVNGSIGIAVGMATNIPPHNMGEVIDGVNYLMDHPDCTVTELMQFIKGPDFPTYGTIHGTAGIYEAYSTGRGRIKVRAKTHFEEKHGRTSIIVTEIPYQVNRSMLLEGIVNLVKAKRIEGISDIRNESGRNGMRIVIDIKREANAQVVLNLLFKYSQLEDTFAINMLALVNGEPKLLGLKEILSQYLMHQENVMVRKLNYDLDVARKLSHIYEGYTVAIDNIDRVIELIRASANVADAKTALMNEFTLSDAQAQAIVDMTLGRLSGLERIKIEEKLAQLLAQIKEITEILADNSRINGLIRDNLNEIKEKYGDERRTEIEQVENEILIEDLIDRVNSVVTVTQTGYIKRLPADTYQAQHRGGKGITAMTTKEEDFVKDVIIAHSHSYLLMFSNLGRVYRKKCYEIPESTRTSRGTNLVNVLSLDENEKITAFVSVDRFSSEEYLMLVTKFGVIKRICMTEYQTKRTGGLFAINLDEGDELLYVLRTSGSDDIITASRSGLAIRFNENDVRAVGRQARGVRAMMLAPDDTIVGVAVITADFAESGMKLITVTEKGFGKRCEASDFSTQQRGGKGMICHRIGERTGMLTGISAVAPDDDLMLITDGGTMIRTPAGSIPVYGRATSGVIVMRTTDDASIISFAVLKPDPEPEEDVSADLETDEDAQETEAEDNGEE